MIDPGSLYKENVHIYAEMSFKLHESYVQYCTDYMFLSIISCEFVCYITHYSYISLISGSLDLSILLTSLLF